MVDTETCKRCQYRGKPNGCEGCLVPIVHEVEEERNARLRAREAWAAAKRHKRNKLLRKVGRTPV